MHKLIKMMIPGKKACPKCTVLRKEMIQKQLNVYPKYTIDRILAMIMDVAATHISLFLPRLIKKPS